MRLISRISLAMMVAMLLAGGADAAEEIRSIPVRPAVSLAYFLKTPESGAKSVLVMFPRGGGQGHFTKGEKGISFSNDFLARSMDRFIAEGSAVVLVGLPSDLELMNDEFRFSEEHYSDIRKLCESLAKDGFTSVYLVSSGSGSLSVLSVANHPLPPQVKGVVLTNPFDFRALPILPSVSQVRLPALIIQHEADECGTFTLEGALKTRDMLSGFTKVEMVRVSGGRKSADECSSLGFHGFNGVEKQVVNAIGSWIAGKPVPERITDK